MDGQSEALRIACLAHSWEGTVQGSFILIWRLLVGSFP